MIDQFAVTNFYKLCDFALQNQNRTISRKIKSIKLGISLFVKQTTKHTTYFIELIKTK